MYYSFMTMKQSDDQIRAQIFKAL
ncbi:transcriptional regulator, partial [Bacillus sp. LR--39]